MLDEFDNAIWPEQHGDYDFTYLLKITPPRYTPHSKAQSFINSVSIQLQKNTVTKFKLKPNDDSYESFYKVEVYVSGRSVPVDVQEWKVPVIEPEMTYTLTASGELEDTLPNHVFDVIDIDTDLEWTLDGFKLIWTEPPTPNQQLQLTLTPGVTLDELILYEEFPRFESCKPLRY
jgi:hypothetical protein